jgi:hypothetical protein
MVGFGKGVGITPPVVADAVTVDQTCVVVAEGVRCILNTTGNKTGIVIAQGIRRIANAVTAAVVGSGQARRESQERYADRNPFHTGLLSLGRLLSFHPPSPKYSGTLLHEIDYG